MNKLVWIIVLILISFVYAELQPGKLTINDVEVPFELKGDINGNGVLDNEDVLLLSKKVLGLEIPYPVSNEILDYNNDRNVNIYDAGNLDKDVNQRSLFKISTIKYGDVSGDEIISSYDASLVLKSAVGLINLDNNQKKAADVSCNGIISAYDAALILQYVSGFIDRFPCEKEIPSKNEKDGSKYSEKEVFLISDKDWRNVLPLIPVTTWTEEDGVHKYPTLIYHEEINGFDADSIVYFMQQYNLEKVTIIGDIPQALVNLLAYPNDGSKISGVGLDIQTQTQKIYPENYLYYWNEYKDVVYVEDNYELAILASTYASLINAPLIIQNSNLDKNENFDNRYVVCVGNVNRNCNENYNLEQLQQKYIGKTNTDKIILVNPNDLDIKVDETFQPKNNIIHELYSKTSLAAPILASAKHEIILSTISTNYQKVDQYIEDKVNNLNLNPNYLTILSSPISIQMTRPNIERGGYVLEVDNSKYGNFDEDPYVETAVGRIFGLTISDVSSYLARDIFMDFIEYNKEALFLSSGMDYIPKIPLLPKCYYPAKKGLENIGFSTEYISSRNSLKPEEFNKKKIIFFDGHGSYAGVDNGMDSKWLKNNNIWLNSPITVFTACSTCNFDRALKQKYTKNLFCVNFLRRGAIAYIGYVESGSGDLIEEIGNGLFNEKIGQSLKRFKNQYIVDKKHVSEKFSSDYYRTHSEELNTILLGDPTIKLDLDKPDLKEINIESVNDNQILINIPERKTEEYNWEYNGKQYIGQNYIMPLGYPLILQADSYISPNIYGEGDYYMWDGARYTWSFSMPEKLKEYEIIEIEKVELNFKGKKYIVTKTPFFPSQELSELSPMIYFEKESEDSKRYWFSLHEIFGGTPRIILENYLPEYNYQIYLKLKKKE